MEIAVMKGVPFIVGKFYQSPLIERKLRSHFEPEYIFYQPNRKHFQ